MTGFENFTIEELKMLAELRNIDCYENVSRQQQESTYSAQRSLYPNQLYKQNQN